VTLDPDDWEEFRSLAHQAVDDLTDRLAGVRAHRVWDPVPSGVAASFQGPAPRQGEGMAGALRDARARVTPYPLGNTHPRHWGWVMGSGAPVSILADIVAAGMDSNCAGFASAATLVEEQAIAWLAEGFGLPAGTSGLFVSSGSLANLTALAVARQARAGYDVRQEGVRSDVPLRLYCSTETHSSIRKGAELLGLGAGGAVAVPVGADHAIDLAALERAIVADRDAGRRPFCVVGNAGTVNTGAVDDLHALADVAGRHGLWFHVDGAFGALAALAPEARPRVAGLERADSLVFCPHKWMYLTYDVSCVLVRDGAAHRAAFALTPTYLAPNGRGLVPRELSFSHLGVDLSRGFRALKVWLALKAHGLDGYGRMVAQNIAQARYLGELIDREPRLELLAPIALNVVCFRFAREGLGAAELDALNTEILMRLQEEGIAAPSGTTVGGRFALRVAIVNHRSRREDLEALVHAVVRLGGSLG
jgi:glutamate/tyrosine decarboxylase-like PLP-dependent enzyme